MIISCLLSNSTAALKSIGETILNITVLLQPSPSSIEIITTGPQIAFFAALSVSPYRYHSSPQY
jgi:hypothetical protein